MKKLKKLYSILDKLTGNIVNDFGLLEKHKKFLLQLSREENFFEYLADYKNDQKLLYFLYCIKMFPQNHDCFDTAIFNSLKIKKNGNNILHLLAQKNNGCVLVLTMIELYDMVSKEEIADEILYTHNLEEKTCLQVLFDNIESNDKTDSTKLIDLLIYLINHNYENILDYKELLEDTNILERIDSIDKSILSQEKKEYIRIKFNDKQFGDFLKQLTDNKEENVNLINKSYGDVNFKDKNGSILHRCAQQYNSYQQIVDEEFSIYFKRLLDAGVDPNIINRNGENFIEKINFKNFQKNDFIYFLMEESIKYGYDCNSHDSARILINHLGFLRTSYRPFNLYKLLCDNGYDTYLYGPPRNLLVSYNPGSDDKTAYKSFLELYDIQYFLDYLIYSLGQNNIKVEKDFKVKFKNIRGEIMYLTSILVGAFEIKKTEELAEMIMEELIKNRKNSVNNISEEISVIELINAFKTLFLQVENIFNEMHDECYKKLSI